VPFKDPEKRAAYYAAYRAKNKEKDRERGADYRARSREKRAAYYAAYRVRNIEEISAKQRLRNKAHRDCLDDNYVYGSAKVNGIPPAIQLISIVAHRLSKGEISYEEYKFQCLRAATWSNCPEPERNADSQ
jgi:hypothetical protein